MHMFNIHENKNMASANMLVYDIKGYKAHVFMRDGDTKWSVGVETPGGGWIESGGASSVDDALVKARRLLLKLPRA